ncbi:MAG: hypothetical protein IH624_16565 [Phycisphaerae bacterium]|nr:hypothetical protein [Phycisphaerae bacterium]
MIPAGYMAKRVMDKPDWLKADGVLDVYSVSNCMSKDFTDYVEYWKHNGYWLFDSPKIIANLAEKNSIDMAGVRFFYYEIYELEFHEDDMLWHGCEPERSFVTDVQLPHKKKLEGFDVVTFSAGSSAECSPLSCNGLAGEIKTNRHCLLESLEQAKQCLESGLFVKSEPGPFRIFAVYSLA